MPRLLWGTGSPRRHARATQADAGDHHVGSGSLHRARPGGSPRVRDRDRSRTGPRLPPVRRRRLEPRTRVARGGGFPRRRRGSDGRVSSTSSPTARSSVAPPSARSTSTTGTVTSIGTSSSSLATGSSTPPRSPSGVTSRRSVSRPRIRSISRSTARSGDPTRSGSASAVGSPRYGSVRSCRPAGVTPTSRASPGSPSTSRASPTGRTGSRSEPIRRGCSSMRTPRTTSSCGR